MNLSNLSDVVVPLTEGQLAELERQAGACCSCVEEAGDSDCARHPTNPETGEPIGEWHAFFPSVDVLGSLLAEVRLARAEPSDAAITEQLAEAAEHWDRLIAAAGNVCAHCRKPCPRDEVAEHVRTCSSSPLVADLATARESVAVWVSEAESQRRRANMADAEREQLQLLADNLEKNVDDLVESRDTWRDRYGKDVAQLRAELAEARATTCTMCEGGGEVGHAPCSVPDCEHAEQCPACGGTGKRPTPEEVAELRNKRHELAGDLQVADAELAMYKARCAGGHPFDLERVERERDELAACLRDAMREIARHGHGCGWMPLDSDGNEDALAERLRGEPEDFEPADVKWARWRRALGEEA